MKVLIAEDNRYFRRLLEVNVTQWGHEVTGCENGLEAWDMLQKPDSPKLAILDWEMPEMSGVEVCKKVRDMEDQPYVYIILLTAKTRKEDVIEGLDSGADDYIMKPFDPLELQVRVRAATRIVQLQEDLWNALRDTERRAREDPLTGLWNHSAGLDILKLELERSARMGTPVGVIMADIDNFKLINDTKGHLAGDEVLKRLSYVMKSELRSYDSVARYGGDEFLIVCPGSSEEEAKTIANRICSTVVDDCRTNSGLGFQYSVSLGLCSVAGGNRVGIDSAVRKADQALYAAKKNGRARVAIWKKNGSGSK